jgi:hypothetical protein
MNKYRQRAPQPKRSTGPILKSPQLAAARGLLKGAAPAGVDLSRVKWK